MALTTSAIYLIGRLHPEIFELLGNPYGPYGPYGSIGRGRVAQAALNPQPLPPGGRAALNPQPIPPGLATGVAAARELVHLAATADRLGIGFDVDPDDWCGTRPRKWPFVWNWWWPIPIPDPDPWPIDFSRDYNLGVVIGLEASAGVWGGLGIADQVERAHDVALETAVKTGGLTRG
ncbi:hypothetical protein [Cellulomonas sp. HZM]|uniref:hypothetical protein n=1 Tax=Cellulomonas sp. HZM TaxID=1454010 RepID=UPI000556D333|nr:hypothetical protein [Cellulomonas sp. HZM]